jgi:hypothetical protein
VPKNLATIDAVRFPRNQLWLLATAEIAGAIGLVSGLYWWPVGVAAAIGVILYFVGAVIAHLRVGDKDIASVAILLAASLAALALRLLTRT